jgi:hypothetical protein
MTATASSVTAAVLLLAACVGDPGFLIEVHNPCDTDIVVFVDEVDPEADPGAPRFPTERLVPAGGTKVLVSVAVGSKVEVSAPSVGWFTAEANAGPDMNLAFRMPASLCP